jgi:hypothetical protein
MTKKDYIKFAETFKWLLKDESLSKETLNHVIKETCDIFASDNPGFDRNRFMDAVKKEN